MSPSIAAIALSRPNIPNTGKSLLSFLALICIVGWFIIAVLHGERAQSNASIALGSVLNASFNGFML